MSTVAFTKEEAYLLQVYKEYLSNDQDLNHCYDADELGKKVGQSPRQIKNSVQTLTSTNFIKKQGKGGILLTKHGLNLALQLGRVTN